MASLTTPFLNLLDNSQGLALFQSSKLDTRYVNVTGDTMTGNLTMPAESFVGPSSTTGIYFKDGNVGIGTTGPARNFHVKSSSAGLPNASGAIANGIGLFGWGNEAIVLGFDNNSPYGGWIQVENIVNVSTKRPLLLQPNGGNVGIGTTGTFSKLHINGGTGSLATGISLGDGDSGIYENSDDNLRFAISNSVRLGLSGTQLYSPNLVDSWSIQVNEEPSATNPLFTFQADTDTGIGKAGSDILSFIAGGTNVLNVTNSNVGIGTTSPTNARLQIEGSSRYDGMFRLVNTGAGGASFFMGSTNDIWDAGGNKFIMGHGSPSSINTDITIDSNGNMGIGTTGPDTKLDVNGALTIRELSADPSDPDEGSFVIWMSDGTGTGDDGDILIKVTAGATTKTTTLVDFSAI